MTNNEPVQMITRIPADLRDRIKAHAALERLSMNELVARVMDAAVLRDLERVRRAAAIKGVRAGPSPRKQKETWGDETPG